MMNPQKPTNVVDCMAEKRLKKYRKTDILRLGRVINGVFVPINFKTSITIDDCNGDCFHCQHHKDLCGRAIRSESNDS